MHSITATMETAELRGYVRARALSAVRAQVQRSIADGHALPAQEGDLVAAALERTVHLVIRELQSPPVIAVPSPHVRLPSAA